jgi:DNA-binding response OmpR family regulator
MERKQKVLVQENEPSLRRVLELSLAKSGLDITAVPDYLSAGEAAGSGYDAVIIEFHPEAMCGSFIDQVRAGADHERIPAILVTTTRRPGDAWRRKYHPDILLYKPFDIRYLERKLLEVLNDRKANEAAFQ